MEADGSVCIMMTGGVRFVLMSSGLNPSEQFVFEVCRKSFLSLWCCANPQGKNSSKELTDVLAICDPDVVLISVKDIALSATTDAAVQWKRWRKKAI